MARILVLLLVLLSVGLTACGGTAPQLHTANDVLTALEREGLQVRDVISMPITEDAREARSDHRLFLVSQGGRDVSAALVIFTSVAHREAHEREKANTPRQGPGREYSNGNAWLTVSIGTTPATSADGAIMDAIERAMRKLD